MHFKRSLFGGRLTSRFSFINDINYQHANWCVTSVSNLMDEPSGVMKAITGRDLSRFATVDNDFKGALENIGNLVPGVRVRIEITSRGEFNYPHNRVLRTIIAQRRLKKRLGGKTSALSTDTYWDKTHEEDAKDNQKKPFQ